MSHRTLPRWMLTLILTGLILGPLTGSPATAPATAAAPELVPGSKLVFESFRDNNWEVYSANDDGSAQQRLTTHIASDLYPRANRGYTRIALASPRDASNYNIFTMNPDGSGLTRLTAPPGENVFPAWSPDGSRIAFSSNRPGNYDIYVMNTDGTNATQLTTDPASDSAPDWSPDGSQIVFVSQRTGGFCIWKMNSDGSGQTVLACQNKSQNPAWSPDGSQIAFDADTDGDGWQELWLMNADGSNPQLLYKPGPNAEAKYPSWSPDGRYIALSYMEWAQQGGVWVPVVQNLQAYDTANPGVLVPLVLDSGKDRHPGWQTTDIWPPTSSVQALPPISTGPFTVSWSGYDNGPAGLCRYDVQYREGADGTWTDWLVQTTVTSAPFPGIGGKTYYFQVRARDCAYNYAAYPGGDGHTHTQVEAWPPQTAVDRLPAYYRGTQILVTWGGHDPGGSGIATYDVQYKDGAGGTWTTWFTQTTATAATFTGALGHTYYFRCRATDHAHNVEPWPAGDGDTSVTMYSWAITGLARDNRETLLADVSANTTPAAFQVWPSTLEGAYASYVAAGSTTYAVSWEKAGYTALATTFGAQDAAFDFILPPGDNVVQNWDLETGQLDPAWLATGVTLPDVTGTLRHTGDYAALLGCQQGDFAAPFNVSNLPGNSATPAVVADGGGDLHVAWVQDGGGYNGEVFYARRAGNTWQPPVNVSKSPLLAASPQIAVDGNGTVHVVWTEDTAGTPEIYYARREAGIWTTPTNISSNPGASRDPQLAVQSNGTVHVLWRDMTATPGVYNVYYAQRTTAWSTPVQVSDNTTSVDGPRLAVDGSGVAHAVWSAGEAYYARRVGSWSEPTVLSDGAGAASAARLALHGSVVHALWIESQSGDNGIYHAHYGASWSAPLRVYGSASALSVPQVAVDGNGVLHAVWRTGTGPASDIYYALRSGGQWSAAENISNTADESSAPRLGVDSTNAAHVAWVDRGTGNYEIVHRDRNGGVWSPLKNASRNAGRSDQPHLFVQGNKTVHLVWADTTLGPPLVLHAQAATNGPAGDSQIAQSMTLPTAMHAPTLSFLYLLDGASAGMGSSMSVQVTSGGSTTTLMSTNASVNDWTHRWFDLSAWAGETITLTFKVSQAADRLCTWGYLDEITLGSSYPDLWIAKTGGATGLPGSTVTYHITYGNRGGVQADGVLITDLLPAELAYLAADPPPDGLSPLTWDVGSLAGRAGPYEIVLMATVQPAAAYGHTYTNTVSIATSTPEDELANNTASAATLIAARAYLPLVTRSYIP